MPSIFSLTSTAFQFYRKQPVLNQITFWLLFLPMLVMDLVSTAVDSAVAQNAVATPVGTLNGMSALIAILAAVFVIYFAVWGQACVLLVGKRIISSPAGRNRTSFKAVRTQARKFIGPILLTTIIRILITAALTLCVLVAFILDPYVPTPVFIALGTICLLPAAVFFLRTIFYAIVIVAEKKQYWPALQASTTVVHNRILRVLLYTTGLTLLIFVPIAFVGIGLDMLITAIPQTTIVAQIIMNALLSFITMLFLLIMVAFYKEMKATA